jgi:hypothetical protein
VGQDRQTPLRLAIQLLLWRKRGLSKRSVTRSVNNLRQFYGRLGIHCRLVEPPPQGEFAGARIGAELGAQVGADGLRSHGSDDPVQFGGDRVQRAGDPVVVQGRRVDTERLLHRPGPGPVRHPQQWRG